MFYTPIAIAANEDRKQCVIRPEGLSPRLHMSHYSPAKTMAD